MISRLRTISRMMNLNFSLAQTDTSEGVQKSNSMVNPLKLWKSFVIVAMGGARLSGVDIIF